MYMTERRKSKNQLIQEIIQRTDNVLNNCDVKRNIYLKLINFEDYILKPGDILAYGKYGKLSIIKICKCINDSTYIALSITVFVKNYTHPPYKGTDFLNEYIKLNLDKIEAIFNSVSLNKTYYTYNKETNTIEKSNLDFIDVFNAIRFQDPDLISYYSEAPIDELINSDTISLKGINYYRTYDICSAYSVEQLKLSIKQLSEDALNSVASLISVEQCIDKIKEMAESDEEGFNDVILNSLHDKCKNYKANYNSIVTKINELQRIANEFEKNIK